MGYWGQLPFSERRHQRSFVIRWLRKGIHHGGIEFAERIGAPKGFGGVCLGVLSVSVVGETVVCWDAGLERGSEQAYKRTATGRRSWDFIILRPGGSAWYYTRGDSSSECSARMLCMKALSWGRLLCEVSQTTFRLTPKYSWIRTFLILLILLQGMSGCSSMNEPDRFLAASPMISSSQITPSIIMSSLVNVS